LSGVYSFMGGQDFAPHTSAKWIRGSKTSTTYSSNMVCGCYEVTVLHVTNDEIYGSLIYSNTAKKQIQLKLISYSYHMHM
jgi:hypothetical protein